MGRRARSRSRRRGPRARALPPRAPHRQGAPLGREPALQRQHRLHQHHPAAPRGADPRRHGDREPPAQHRALERGGDGAARRQEGPGARRPHRELRLRRHALRRGLQPLLARAHREARRRPHLHPGPLLAGRLRARLPRGAPHRGAARHVPPGGRRQGDLLLSAPVAHARLLAVPDGVDGPGPDPGHLPGALPALPGGPRARQDRAAQGVGLHGRRRDGRARVDGRHRHGGARRPRQPRLRRQLQPAAPRRPGARQRQDHPGAGDQLPRRRLERDQADLGLLLGPAARQGQGRHPPEAHGGGGRRRVPEVQEPRRRLRARALLRQVPGAEGDGGQHVRRGHLAPEPRRPRPAQDLRGLRRGREAQGPAHGHPRQDREGLRHGRGGRGQEHRPPAEEDAARGAQAVPRPLRDPDRATTGSPTCPTYKPADELAGDEVPAGGARAARRLASRSAAAARRASTRRSSRPSSRCSRPPPRAARSPPRWPSCACSPRS